MSTWSLSVTLRTCTLALGLLTVTAPAQLAPQGSLSSAWLPGLGSPDMDNQVSAFTVFDDGDGPALYAGGRFEMAGGVSAKGIARLIDSNWSPLGSGVNGEVNCLTVFDDGLGGGPALFAGGSFSTAGGVPASNIAKWDGASWSALGSGLGGTLPNGVTALTVFDDGLGGGPALYVGGLFTTAGGAPANRVARWNGTSWSALGTGTNNVVRSLIVFDQGSGPRLYAGGEFNTAGAVAASGIARWNGANWSAVKDVSGAGVPGVDGWVWGMAVYDDGLGGGAKLFVTGSFTGAGIKVANSVARWNGTNWEGVGSGIGSGGISVGLGYALTVHDDGGSAGPALYVGGDFITAGGAPAKYTAKWNGAAWSAQGVGMNNRVRALAMHDDGSGSGPALFVGGWFTMAGGLPALRLARWDGTSWSAVGGGTNAFVDALTVHDDGAGGGPALFVAGSFTTAGVVSANRIAKWDGTSWTALAGGLNNQANALATFDDGLGGGPALYVGGFFTTANFAPANRIARWNGTSWSALGSGVDIYVRSLAAFDAGDGSGPALYAGGAFLSAGGTPVNRIASWDGAGWSVLGSGANNQVDVLAVHDDGQGGGPALFVGGNFSTAGDLGGGRLAKWGQAPPPSAWSNQGSSLAGALGNPLLSGTGALAAGSNNSVTLTNAAPSALAGLFVSLASTPLPFKGGMLLPLPVTLLLFLGSSPAGTIPLQFTMPAGVPAGVQLWLQWAIQDAGAVQGVALSNAILGLAP